MGHPENLFARRAGANLTSGGETWHGGAVPLRENGKIKMAAHKAGGRYKG